MSIFKMLSGFTKSDKNGSEDELNSLKLSAIKELDLSDLVIESEHTKSREQIIQEINKDVYQCEQQSESYSQRRRNKSEDGTTKITTLSPTHSNSSSSKSSIYDFAPYQPLNSHSTGSHSNECTSWSGSGDSGSSDSGGSCD